MQTWEYVLAMIYSFFECKAFYALKRTSLQDETCSLDFVYQTDVPMGRNSDLGIFATKGMSLRDTMQPITIGCQGKFCQPIVIFQNCSIQSPVRIYLCLKKYRGWETKKYIRYINLFCCLLDCC